MPDRDFDPHAWRQVAIEALERYLCMERSARPLTPRELNQYRQRMATHGWRIPLDRWAQGDPALDMIIDGAFPYAAPRVALEDRTGVLIWPHVERDGGLCVFPEHATVSSEDPVYVAKSVIEDAENLIAECCTSTNEDDFREEFISYWSIASADDGPQFISLIEPIGPSRRLALWRGRHSRVVANDRATLERWLMRRGSEKPKKGFTFHDAVLLWLPTPLTPPEYPNTGPDIRRIATELSQEAVQLVEGMVSADTPEVNIVIGAPTTHGACFGAISFSRPEKKELLRGFRTAHVPKSVLIERYLGATRKAKKAVVRRADHRWIHGRDQDLSQLRLRQARVCVLGCGAVGSGVARLLTQSGVGNVTLLDPQQMDWPNISRHTLGADAIPNNKAIALADNLCSDFPHLGEIEGRAVCFDLTASATIDELSTFDLIISATGEWGVDTLLNDLQRTTNMVPAVVYAWLEPHAGAAHSLLLSPGDKGQCLRCGFSNTGRIVLPVTSWPANDGLLQEPACGAVFSPFGAVELSWANSLIAEHVIDFLLGAADTPEHRVWIGHNDRIEALGGQWSPQWCIEIGNPGDGGFTLRKDWPVNHECPLCKNSEAA
ncbi:MAG: ThiF family adenylyltransferase [Candidatus Thiodiazotropha sp. (ex Ctena orbiculata)]|nr:ThiF family adenylyltransferase [Candidatus Thiodiazotropha taylori]MBT3035633.1 ThiF family adenylyltransferase [Candidatus Thiodiazotropha taylori]